MNKFLKVVASIFLVQSIFMPLTNDFIVSAQTGSTYLSLDSDVTNSLLDENNDSIYLVAPNRLYFIKASTMEVSKTISFDGNPTDLDLYNGKLYLPLENQILVVDSIKRTKVDTLPVSASRLAFDQNKMFYSTKNSDADLWVFDLYEGKNLQKILSAKDYTSTFSNPDLAIDYQKHILYVGESGLGANLFSFSTIDYKKVGKSTYDLGTYYGTYDKKIVFDGKEVFFNSYSFDASDFSQLNGHFSGDTTFYVKGNNIYSKKAIYDRRYFVKIASLPVETTVVCEDSKGFTYYFDSSSNKFIKAIIPKSLPITNYSLSDNKLTITGGITDWVVHDEKGLIYGVSENTNKLYWIRKSDLKIVKEIFVGCKPTDVEFFNGKLYIPLGGTTKTIEVDSETGEITDRYNLATFPLSVQINDKYLFYNDREHEESVYVYEIQGKNNQRINYDFYNQPSLFLDRTKGVLYIADSLNSQLYSLNISNMALSPCFKLYEENSTIYHSPQRTMIKDGENIYFAGYRFNANQITNEAHLTFYNDAILFARGDKVFGKEASYDKVSGTRITPKLEGVDLVYMDPQNWVYCYGDKTQSIYKSSFKNYVGGVNQPKPISKETFFKDFPLPATMLAYIPTDIDQHWAENYLRHFVFAGLLKGYVDEKGMYTIKPNNKITRAEFVTILVRALTLHSQDSGKSFVDVKKDDWYYDSVRIASSLKIVNGIDATHFAPNNPIKRDEMAAIIIRAMGATLDKSGEPKDFSDISGNWARNSILEATKAGIINGFEDGTFRPSQNATRAESVKMLYTAMKKQITNLPKDENLILYVKSSENNNFQEYTAGFQFDYNTYLYNIFNRNHDDGYFYSFDSWGPYDVQVLEKSNSLAVLRMKGGTRQFARYKVINGITIKEVYKEELDILVFIIINNGYINTYYSQPYSN